jgi:hypothetical protein
MPILNLPDVLTFEQIKSFRFGDIDAFRDELLKERQYVCVTDSMYSFMDDRKNIAIGDKGSGKSALFKMIQEGVLNFEPEAGYVPIVIPIGSPMDYHSMRNRFMKYISSTSPDETFRSQAFWELYLLYVTVGKIRELGLEDDNVRRIASVLYSAAGIEQHTNVSFFEYLASVNISFSCKIYSTPESLLPVPDFTLHACPTDNAKAPLPEKIDLNIEEAKRSVCAVLETHKKQLYLMVDRLDEFVTGADYEVQKSLISGLIGCLQSYLDHRRLSLKFFLRSDLFHGVSFEGYGYNKVFSRVTEILWTDSDIVELIALRILWNYVNKAGLDLIHLECNNQYYCFGDCQKPLSVIDRVVKHVRLVLGGDRQKCNNYTESNVSVRDSLNEIVITSIFPRNLPHKRIDGKDEEIAMSEYFTTHFKTSSGTHNPRLVISFLNKCMEKTVAKIRSNLVKEVQLNTMSEYELFKKCIVKTSYALVQDDAWREVVETSKQWKADIKRMARYKLQGPMSYSYLKEKSELDDDKLELLLKFLSHLGVLRCHNPDERASDKREYELPIVYKQIFVMR